MMNRIIRILLLLGVAGNLLHGQTPMTFDWVKPINGASVSVSHTQLDAMGNIINGGLFQSWVDLDPGPDTLRLQSIGNNFSAFIQKLDNKGNLIWALPFFGKETLGTQSLEVLPNGDMLLGIVFTDTLFCGNQVITTNASNFDFVIIKLDAGGTLLWVRHFTGDKDQYLSDLKIDSSGNIYATGYHVGVSDFDPDPVNAFLLSTPLNNSIGFVLKLNPDGALIQVKELTSTNFTSGSVMGLYGDKVYIGGTYSGVADFDPGVGQQNMTAINNWDGFVLSLDTSFNFKWVLPLEGTGVLDFEDLDIDSEGNLFLGGGFNGGLDLDPGIGQTLVTANGPGDVFLLKISSEGNWFWTKYFGGTEQEYLYQTAIDHLNNVYLFGIYRGSPDFDPGPGERRVITQGSRDGFVLKLDPEGQFLDVRSIGGPGVDDIRAGAIDQDLNVYISGRCFPICDFDPGAPVYTLPLSSGAFTEVLTQQFHCEGRVFRDLNGNGLKDTGEPPLPGAIVSAKKRQAFASSDTSGNYFLNYRLNQDTLTLKTRPYWTVTPPFYAVSNNQTNLDFAVNGPIVKDICITAAALSVFRPGFQNDIVIQVSNPGGIPVNFIPVRLKIITQTTPDPLQLLSAVPTPSETLADELRWTIPALNEGDVFTIRVTIKTPASVPNGTPVKISMATVLDDDLDPSNNGLYIESLTTGSFDPNDKQVTPSKVTPEALDTTELHYVVRFQNTGTFAADRVVIRDTLPKGIDIATLRVLGSSHPCTWRLYDGCLLEFTFDPIVLPDSASNETASKGFVVFGVQPQPWLKVGDLVKNRVGIYFDFNEPVVTQYANLKVVQTVGIFAPPVVELLDFQINPNPVVSKGVMHIAFSQSLTSTADIRIYDMQGRMVHRLQMAGGEQQFSLPVLSPGNYFLQADAGGRTGMKLLIVSE